MSREKSTAVATQRKGELTLPGELKFLGPSVETRAGYYGGGAKVHLYVGDPERGWWCVCGGVPHNVNRARPDYRDGNLPEAPDGVRVDCWRCARATGKIDRYPGPEKRREIEANNDVLAGAVSLIEELADDLESWLREYGRNEDGSRYTEGGIGKSWELLERAREFLS